METVHSAAVETAEPLRFSQRPAGFGLAIPLVMAGILVLTGLYNYLLYHTLAELFAVCVAILAAVVGWQTYPYSRNNFLTYLATGYFWVALLDLAHTLTFKGMGILPIAGANTGTQFWLLARYLEAGLLLSAPVFLTRSLPNTGVVSAVGGLAAVGTGLVISGVFPAAYVEPDGLTRFKILSEYLIVVVLTAAFGFLWLRRRLLDGLILRLMSFSIAFTILAELAFTLYVDVSGVANLVGHVAKLFSYWFIYVAIIQTTLTEPFRVLARDAGTYDAVPDPTIVVSRSGEIHQANRAARNYVGSGGITGLDCHTLLHPKGLDRSECPVCRRLERLQPVSGIEMAFPERDEWHLVTLAPAASTGSAGMVHVSRDITDRKRAEERLQSSERKYRALLENASDGIVLADLAGNIVDANRTILQTLGYSKQRLLGMGVQDIHPPDQLPHLQEAFRKMNAGGVSLFEHPVITAEGEVIPMEVAGVAVDVGGAKLAIGMFRDIRARKKAEADLRESEEKYRTLVENLPQRVFFKDLDGTYRSCNRNYAVDLGLSPAEVAGKTDFDIHPRRLAEKYRADDRRVMTSGTTETIEEEFVRRGAIMTVQTVKTPVRDDEGKVVGVLGIFWDITEQKRARETLQLSEARYRAVVEDQTDLIARFDGDGRFTFMNGAMRRYFGPPQGAGECPSFFHCFTDRDEIRGFVRDLGGEGQVRSGEFQVVTADGPRWTAWTVRAIGRESGSGLEYQSVGRDITEHRRADEQLRRSLKEKEVLLREVHHRVKNNMQVISSMLGLEANKLTDRGAANAFKDAEGRIRAMALIHERLYRFGDLARVNCGHYIRDLVSDLVQAHRAAINVRCELDLEPITLPIDLAIPFGLVVNELVSNALKHAFPEGGKGTLSIGLHADGERLVLRVADDGVGMPPTVEPDAAKTLGLRLIRQLVATQLHGEAKVSAGGGEGTVWEIVMGRPSDEVRGDG